MDAFEFANKLITHKFDVLNLNIKINFTNASKNVFDICLVYVWRIQTH